VHGAGEANLASGERRGLAAHAGLAGGPPCRVGCSARPAEMDAAAILSEGSIRQEALTDAKCGVGCKI